MYVLIAYYVINISAKIIKIDSCVSLPAIFWVLEITYSQDATTNINAKYVKRRGSAPGCTFWGSQKPKFNIYIPYLPQTAILGPDLDGT